MANTYPDIAIRPGIATYPFANQGDNSVAAGADADGSEFRRILNMSAPTAVSGTQAATSAAATSSATTSAAASSSTTAPASSSAGHLTFAGFMKDLFDIINPLQHIPVIGALYRHITGDTISPEAEFIGDALYGGPVGGAVAAANIAYQEETGKNIGQTVIAGLTGGNNSAAQTSAPQTMVAQNLTALSPAAVGGQASANNIIWSKAPAQVASLQPVFSQSVSLLSPPSTTPGTIGEGPVSPSTAPPALQPKGAASTIVLHTQEAPAGKARKAMPPELIAQKMMEGLQKYAAMKQQSLAPTLSASY